MGYTHYWETRRPFTDLEWRTICKSTELLLRKLPAHSTNAGGYYSLAPLLLRGPLRKNDTEHKPQTGDELVRACVLAERIWIEGAAANGEDLSHESFVLERDDERAFCKTARKPYDLVVCAILAVAETVAPDAIEVTSDGEADDWWPAIEWASYTLDTVVLMPVRLRHP